MKWLLSAALCVGITGISLGSANAADATLSWNTNGESDLAGYKIYFAPQSCSAAGPLAPLVVSGSQVVVARPANTYRHVNIPVMDGTMCWEITAYDTSANESGRSNRVSKTVNLIPPVPPTGLDAVIQ